MDFKALEALGDSIDGIKGWSEDGDADLHIAMVPRGKRGRSEENMAKHLFQEERKRRISAQRALEYSPAKAEAKEEASPRKRKPERTNKHAAFVREHANPVAEPPKSPTGRKMDTGEDGEEEKESPSKKKRTAEADEAAANGSNGKDEEGNGNGGEGSSTPGGVSKLAESLANLS